MKSDWIKYKKSLCLCLTAFLAACFPIACNYVIDSGMVRESIAWTEGMLTRLGSGRLTGNVVAVYRLFLLALQLGTLLTSMLFFGRVFRREGKFPAAVGSMFYLCCPYRIYVCYDAADFKSGVFWMLLPLLAWVVWGLSERIQKVRGFILGGVLILFGAVLFPFLPSAGEAGYHLGEYLTSYAFLNGHPGLGLGMLLAIVFLLWDRVSGQKDRRMPEGYRGVLSAALVCVLLSLSIFPRNNAAFAGLGSFFLCIPAAWEAEKLYRKGEKREIIMLTLILAAAIGICIYQCNMLTYNRLPLEIV